MDWIWRLQSPRGNATDCFVDQTTDGCYQVTLAHNGVVAAGEVCATETEAYARARGVGRALIANGWMEFTPTSRDWA